MAIFTTESDVRDKFQLTDTALVPASLVASSIADANTELLRFLDPVYDTGSPADGQVLGETLLAGAHLLRSLASKDGFEQKSLSIGGQRVDGGDRFAALTSMAASAEEQAWGILEPFLLDRSARAVLKVTDTTPVLGEE